MTTDCGEYEKMIEIPLASCEYVHKRKPRTLKKSKFIKRFNALLKRETKSDNVSAQASSAEEAEESKSLKLSCEDCSSCDCGERVLNAEEKSEERTAGKSRYKNAKAEEKARKKAAKKEAIKKADEKISDKKYERVISAQIAAAFLLVVAIILTNVFWENSGMNAMFKSVFGGADQTEDERVYTDFSLNLPVRGEGVTYTEGVISVSGEHFVYPVCDGKVSKVEKDADGRYTVTVSHSESFKSVIQGADFVCFESGEAVNKNVPVCHTKKGVSVYLYNDDTLITGFVADENSIIWEK